jgi:hypothetical protein
MSARPNPTSSSVRRDHGSARAALTDAIKRRKQRLRDAQDHAKGRLKALDDQISLELDAIDSRLSAWVEFQGDMEEQQRQGAIEREQLERLSEKIQRRQAETEAQRQQIARKLAAQRRDVLQAHEEGNAELVALRQENAQLQLTMDELNTQIRRLQSQIEESQQMAANSQTGDPSPDGNGETSEVLEQLQTNLEQALDELQTLRDENEHLKFQVATAPVRRPKPRNAEAPFQAGSAAKSGGGSDWESQKKRLLAQLEDDVVAGDEDSETPGEWSDHADEDFNELVGQAEQLVAARDEEIRSLKDRILAAETLAIAKSTDESTEQQRIIAEFVDQDAIIISERERLKKLQDEWEERSRKAEVETAMERARIARMRTEFEEKLRDLEAKQQQFAQRNPSGNTAGKPERERRWLDHLSRPREPDKS